MSHPLSRGTRRRVLLLSMICFVILTLLVVLIVLLIVAPDSLMPPEQGGPLSEIPQGLLRGLAIALGVALLLPPIWAILSLMRLCSAYLRNEVLAPAPARHLMSMGLALIATAVLKAASVPLFDLLVFLATVETGQETGIGFAIGPGEAALVAGGLLLRTIGRVLLEAASDAGDTEAPT